MADLEIQFYDPSGTPRNVDEALILQGVTFEYLDAGGMGQSRFPIHCLWEGDDYSLSPVQIGDTVKVWVDGETYPRYVGTVTEPDRNLSTTESLVWIAYGEMERMNSIVLTTQQMVEPGRADLAVFAQRILDEYNEKRGTSFGSDFQTTGITLDLLKLDQATARQAMDALFKEGQGSVVWGWEVNPADGSVRCYLRKRTIAIDWQKEVGENVKMLSERKPVSECVNAIFLTGGKASYPNEVGLVAKTDDGKPNASFEYPIPSSASSNILYNPSFTKSLSFTLGWTLGGGAAQNGLAGQSDGMGIELSASATATQQFNTAPIALVPGHTYRVGVAARRGALDGKRVILTFKWRNAAGTQVGSDQIEAIDITDPLYSAIWTEYPTNTSGPAGFDMLCPSGATGYSIEFRGDNALGTGVGSTYIDDAFLYDIDAATQPGWKFVARGSAAGSTIDWAYPDGYDGKTCIKVTGISVADSDGNDVSVQLEDDLRPKIHPLQTDKIGFWYKSPPGATSTPKTRLRIAPKKSDGSNASAPSQWDGTTTINGFGDVTALTFDVAASGSPTTDWTFLGTLAGAASDWDSIEYAMQLRSSGELLLDAALVMDNAGSAGGFIPGDTFQRYVKATEICEPSSDAYASESLYGLREKAITIDTISNWGATARDKVKTYFEQSAVLSAPRRLDLDDDTELITPALGTQLRVSGVEEDLSDQWPVRVQCTWDGKLAQSIELGAYEKFLTKQISLLTSGGGVSVGGGSGGSNIVNTAGDETIEARTRDAVASWWTAFTFANVKAHFAGIWSAIRWSASNVAATITNSGSIVPNASVTNGSFSYQGATPTATKNFTPANGFSFKASNSIGVNWAETSAGTAEFSFFRINLQNWPAYTTATTLSVDELAQFDTTSASLPATVPSAGFYGGGREVAVRLFAGSNPVYILPNPSFTAQNINAEPRCLRLLWPGEMVLFEVIYSSNSGASFKGLVIKHRIPGQNRTVNVSGNTQMRAEGTYRFTTSGGVYTATLDLANLSEGEGGDITIVNVDGSNVINVVSLSGASEGTRSATVTVSPTGTITNGSRDVTSVSSLTGLFEGMTISRTGIPANTRIAWIDTATNTIRMSAAATSNATGTLTCTYTEALEGPTNAFTVPATAGASVTYRPSTTGANRWSLVAKV